MPSFLSILPLASVAYTAAVQATEKASVQINAGQSYQVVDGFGFSEAFGRAEDVFGGEGLSQANVDRLLDLFYDLETGAGFTILRNGIGSGNASDPSNMLTIELTDPGSPSSKPTYTPNNNTGQLPLAQAAYARGLQTLYADAWSAPWFMKTNLNDNDGGYLCGVSGTDCPTGNWMQAYADYLLEYVKLYREANVTVTNLGFLNEPQFNASYAAMLSNGTQAAEFIRVLAKTIETEGIDIELNCCDGIGWEEQEQMMAGLNAGPDPAINYLSVVTGHGYDSPPNFTLSTNTRAWLTEWADLSGDYFPHTFFADGGPAEGMTWANNIQVAFTQANVSAFLYWIGAENATASSSLINLLDNEIVTSKRYWVFSQFSKYVRPGARRIEAKSSASNVYVTAFKNTDGTIAAQVLSNCTESTSIEFQFSGPGTSGLSTASHYVTDNQHDLHHGKQLSVDSQGKLTAVVPPRSLVSFVVQ